MLRGTKRQAEQGMQKMHVKASAECTRGLADVVRGAPGVRIRDEHLRTSVRAVCASAGGRKQYPRAAEEAGDGAGAYGRSTCERPTSAVWTARRQRGRGREVFRVNCGAESERKPPERPA